MNVLDLFSGIGGFSLGLERAGMRTVAFCEIEPYCQAVLRKHWPNVPVFGDVRELTAATLNTWGISVDVICGGFPCQDISIAGRGVGIEGERSGLWKEYARIIGELRPKFIIVENVAALLNRGLDVVLGDLAALGYDAEWHCVPASYIGAPHRRDRLWLMAYPNRHRTMGERRNAHSGDIQRNPEAPIQEWQDIQFRAVCPGSEIMAHPDSSNGFGWGSPLQVGWGSFAREIANDGEFGGTQWGTEPDVGRVAHGVPARVDRLKGLGNSVVPQIPEIIGRAIMRLAKQCRHCEKFEALGYRCAAESHLECDCPKCQGFCECPKDEASALSSQECNTP